MDFLYQRIQQNVAAWREDGYPTDRLQYEMIFTSSDSVAFNQLAPIRDLFRMHAKEVKQMERRRMMYAVEFMTEIKEGMIEVPEAHRKRFKDNVKVILLSEEEIQENGDMIATLLEHPLTVPDFTPLTREDTHVRL